MTRHPTTDRSEPTPGLPAPSSANGSQPGSTLLAARDLAAVGIDTARQAADLNGGQRVVGRDAAERPAADFLTALGVDLDPENRRATPARMARAYAELLAAEPFRLTTFPNNEGYDELVLARGIPFRTLCEHHMLLFSGVAHV